MFEKPLLQDNILDNLIFFNRLYLMSSPWLIWIGIVFLVLACAVFLLRKPLVTAPAYSDAADLSVHPFNKTQKSDWLGAAALIAAIVLTAARMFGSENSLFENFDLMAVNTTRTMLLGVVAPFDEIRVAPLSFWYLNSLYAVTQNIYLIKTFVLMQLILAFALLYYLFDFIPVTKRLVMLALFALSPTMFSTANIIFAERNVIIALAASLIFAKRYCRTKKLSSFSGFLFFMTVAIYTKETSCLFFGGILAASVLWNIWAENITLKSFLHPFRTIKTFPVEFIAALNLFLYATIYFLMIQPTKSYAAYNTFEPVFLLLHYKFELILLATALLLCLVSCYKTRNTPINPLFRNSGFLCGAALLACGIIFGIKIAPASPHLYGKTYYLVLTLLFSLSYLFEHLQNKKVLCLLTLVLAAYSLPENLKQYRGEVGGYYRETAEFLAQNLSKEQTNIIFIAEKKFERENLTIFVILAHSSAYRYYFKDYSFIFKSVTPLFFFNFPDKSVMEAVYFPIIPRQKVPSAGDWLILNKEESYPDIERAVEKQTPLFENKIFKVYHVK